MNALARRPAAAPIDDTRWLALFRALRTLVASQKPEAEFVEIRTLLKPAPAVARAMGWSCRPPEVEEAFGRLFHRLDWEARKGREARKFVRLADRFGQMEPFVLIKLQEA